jgi:hypothetical protein
MNIKQSLLPCLALSALAALPSLQAGPLLSIGNSADLFFNGSTSLMSTSNLFRDEDNEESDLVWSVTPGFELNFGRGQSNADFSVVTQYEIRRYSDNSRLDTELFSINAVGSIRTSRLDLSVSAGFNEQKSSSGDETFPDDLIESDNTNVRLNGEYRFSPKFSVGSGFSYSEREYVDFFEIFLADRETLTVPLDLYYELTPKVDLSVGYSYTETDVDDVPIFPRPGYTTESHFFNVGARGNLLPKLTGFFKVGYRTREDDRAGVDDDSTLGLDADLAWTATPKLRTRLGLTRDFGVGGEGQSTENTGFDLNATYAINAYYAATAFASYELRDYQGGREDDQYRLGTSLNYTPNQYLRFSAGYTYSENESNFDFADYVDHTFSISASLRY